jgi:hypothetical protein
MNLKTWFNSLPGAVQVIIYSGVSVLLGQGVADLTKIQTMWAPYLITILTIGINITGYLILHQKQDA